MKHPKQIAGFVLLSVFLIVAAGIFWQQQSSSQNSQARQRLNRLLQEHPDPVLPHPAPERETPSFPDVGQWLNQGFSNLSQAISPVQVEETPEAYVVRVELGDGGDADQIQVNVQPHSVQIQGSFREQSNGVSSSRQFMQSFTSQAELDPDHVTRSIENQTLIIQIPKTGKNPQEHAAQPSTRPDKQLELPLDALRELEQSKPRSI